MNNDRNTDTSPAATRRTSARPIVYPTPPTYLASVPASVLFNDRKPGWSTKHRDFFRSRGLEVPNMLDVNAERLRRRAADNNNKAAAALARTGNDVEPLPLLSDYPSPKALYRLRVKDKVAYKREKYDARKAAEAA